ncbi:hypothetical protein [Thalassotalea euphylliae]|nr:hypothetical protein [Thalassotalea euphylliae]
MTSKDNEEQNKDFTRANLRALSFTAKASELAINNWQKQPVVIQKLYYR